ncbi:MAG: flippase-like domain-containing protein [Chloroflexi bacterium]|nr:flippase-like domain-containing protein [Chloroflexota bacterium]
MMRKQAVNLLKIGVTVLGLYLVLREVDLASILDVLRGVKLGWLLVSFLLVNASLVLRAYRWLLLLRGVGTAVPFSRLVELYFVGNFFNMFLLSGFGGDVVRVLESARDVPGSVAAGTVILDRFTGLIMLFVMALCALPWRPDNFPVWLVWFIVAGAAGGVGLLAMLMQGSWLRRLGGWLPGPLSPVGDGPIASLLQAVEGCGWRAVGRALLVSLLFNLMLVLWWQTNSLALGLSVGYGYLALVVPVLSVLLLVPSVSGLGTNEAAAPVLFAAAGLGIETAVALSLLNFLVVRLSGILGAPVYLWTVVRNGRSG